MMRETDKEERERGVDGGKQRKNKLWSWEGKPMRVRHGKNREWRDNETVRESKKRVRERGESWVVYKN